MQCCSLVVAGGGMGLFLANSCGSALLLFRVKKNCHTGNEGFDSKNISVFYNVGTISLCSQQHSWKVKDLAFHFDYPLNEPLLFLFYCEKHLQNWFWRITVCQQKHRKPFPDYLESLLCIFSPHPSVLFQQMKHSIRVE